MDRRLIVSSPSEPRVRLRAAGPNDLDNLRVWKNANKAGFFFKGEITPETQAKWYAEYLARPNDFMFIVEDGGVAAGCMGFRILEGAAADTYNMIAAPHAKGKGVMKTAMIMMCSYIAEKFTKDIGCLVIKGNDALKYYEHCGYRVVGSADGHVVLKVEWSSMKPIPVLETE